ncbi:cytoplasmic protein NCK2a isoform X2 [Vanacampus margaritifer]
MSVMRRQRAKVKPKEEAAYFSSLGKEKHGFTIKYINSFKGRGVFSTCSFQKGDFLIEYRGELVSKQERENRLRVYHDALKVFMFEFRFNGKTLCIDAARDDNSLGRLVNDEHISPNSKMQRITVDGQPHLCLFATKDIEPGEEITYNYGNFDFPWRLKVSTEKQPDEDTAITDCAKVDQVSIEAQPEEDAAVMECAKVDQVSIEAQPEEDAAVMECAKVDQVSIEAQPEEDAAVMECAKVDQVSIEAQPDEDAAVMECAKVDQKCKHQVVNSLVSSLDKCAVCFGPFAALKWNGIQCNVCFSVWHISCFKNAKLLDDEDHLPLVADVASSSEDSSAEEYIPDSQSSSDTSYIEPLSEILKSEGLPGIGNEETAHPDCTERLEAFEEAEQLQAAGGVQKSNTENEPFKESTGTEEDEICSSNISSENKKNYCCICGKPQTKFARHLKTHEKTYADVAQVLALPKGSKERKKMLDKLRNKGNFEHNKDVMQSGTGLLKIKRKPKNKYDPKEYVHCIYCQGMFLRRVLWRHVRKCSMKAEEESPGPGKTRVLTLARMSESVHSQPISQGVWKLLSVMNDDDVAAIVRRDFCILQLAQSFFNKHGQDPTKFEYVRQKLREVGRLLLILRTEFSLFTFEEAVKPANFHLVVQAVKKVSGFDEEKHCYKTPSLALKLGHSLHKICDILHCRALMSGDKEMQNSAKTFQKLQSSKWSELVSHTAFTEDVQRLHRHLETTGSLASENLDKIPSTKVYGELCRVTLAKIILFNRRRGGEVAKMQLKSFLQRDTADLHKDVAVGLTKFEQKLCKHFSRVEIRGKRGRKVAVLLSPDMVDSLTQLINKRKDCEVPEDNIFLFARPNCLTPYRGSDCLRTYANECGAQNPEHLRSTQLRKHVATLSQVLNLKNHELDQVADFLGHDIRVHREYYRLPEATTQLAKISKLLIAMEKGTLASLQGKTLEEIEIEDTIDVTASEQSAESEAEEYEPQSFQQTNMDIPPTDDPQEGTSRGAETLWQPVKKPSGPTHDIPPTDDPQEGTSRGMVKSHNVMLYFCVFAHSDGLSDFRHRIGASRLGRHILTVPQMPCKHMSDNDTWAPPHY